MIQYKTLDIVSSVGKSLGDSMANYIVLEVGKSARTEFLMNDGEFEETEDAVVIGRLDAGSKEEAISLAVSLPYCKNREFDNLVAYEVRD